VTKGRPPSQQFVPPTGGGEEEVLLELLFVVIPLGEVEPLIPPPDDEVGEPRSYAATKRNRNQSINETEKVSIEMKLEMFDLSYWVLRLPYLNF